MSSILERSAVFRSWTRDPIIEQIREVTPVKKLKDMFLMEVQEATITAFQNIGYECHDVHDAFDKVWARSKSDDLLSDFIYSVWEVDKNEQG